MFLTPEQLTELTGYIRSAGQRRWLARQGFRFWIRADGRPAVPANQLAGKQSAQSRWEPDLSAMDLKR